MITLLDPANSAFSEAFTEELLALRRTKDMTLEQARVKVREPLCHANLMVRLGHAHGSVAGAVYTTADVVRSAIQLIGIQPGVKLVSSFFFNDVVRTVSCT